MGVAEAAGMVVTTGGIVGLMAARGSFKRAKLPVGWIAVSVESLAPEEMEGCACVGGKVTFLFEPAK